MKNIIIINGPNLNLLGSRETEIYGVNTFSSHFDILQKKYPNDVNLSFFQSNIEGELIDKLHEVGFVYDGIILNAGAYTHTSIALGDAIKAIKTSVLEIHISNISARESFRHTSYITPNAIGIISGLGLKSYDLALDYFVS